MKTCNHAIEFAGGETKIFMCEKKKGHAGRHEASMECSSEAEPHAVSWDENSHRFEVGRPTIVDGKESFVVPEFLLQAKSVRTGTMSKNGKARGAIS